ncbi:MAG: macrocin O-methyltransferase [Gemmatimonadetes bacterium]|nr:MAG: macrocin O-methyltransferase [Gemmatimonadota bacterium]
MKKRYLNLLKSALLNEIYLENELRIYYLHTKLQEKSPFFRKPSVSFEELHNIRQMHPTMFEELYTGRQVGEHIHNDLQHLVYAHTMIGRKRLENVEYCLNEIIKNDIPGDLIECGVWHGGVCIFMRGVLAVHEISDRTVWVADSFEGLPLPERPEDEPLQLHKENVPGLSVSLQTVQENFRRYDLLDSQVKFVKGWFKDTLPTVSVQQLALLRVDGDLFGSTWQVLTALYEKVSAGGFVIIDDYGAVPQCKSAVQKFRQTHTITAPLHPIDWTGVYWQKD